jgi:hypothetical protein
MNMFNATKAKTVGEYLRAVPQERKEAMVFLHKFIRSPARTLKPYFASNMLGYGKFKYRNYKGEVIDWPIVALASQKNYISVYVCALDGKKYVAEIYKKKLGKVSVGRSCIRFRKLEDVELPVLKKVIQIAAKNPGL